MCLNISNKFSQPLIATEDICCYKLLEVDICDSETYVTPYRNMPVKIGCTYTSELSFNKHGNIEKGLHAYKYLSDVEYLCIFRYEVVVKCLIPKGSRYYRGTFSFDESLASDQLTYVEIIKRN